jgi:hypothetical protein
MNVESKIDKPVVSRVELSRICETRKFDDCVYQRAVLCRCRPISQKVMPFVETLMTFTFRLALVLK